MKRAKKPKQPAPDFYEFLRAADSDPSLAARMIAGDANWLHIRNGTGETALHYLAVENRLDAVRFLLEKGASVNASDHFNSTPLVHAAQLGHLEIVRLLLQHGADPNIFNQTMNWTALHYAAHYGHVEVLELLLQAGGHTGACDEWNETVSEVLLPRKREALLAVLRSYNRDQNELP